MFLTARIFGVLVYVSLLLAVLLTVRYLPQRSTKYVLSVYLLALCAVAWFYVPYITTDIYRLQPVAQHYAQMYWRDFIYLFSDTKSGLFTLIYFRIFSDCLMPVTCAIVFGTIFYIIYQSGQLFKVTRSVLLLVLFWIMTNDFFLMSISNIRSYVAIAFVCFCIYREIFKRQFGILNILLYLCAIEMHTMGIVLVGFRIFMYLFSGGKVTIWKILLVPILVLGMIKGFALYEDLLFHSIDKFNSYYRGNDYNYVWERVIYSLQTFVQGYILYQAYKYCIFKEEYFKEYRNIVFGGFLVLIICHLHVTFMQRWIIFATVLEIPILVRLLQKEYENNKHQIRQFLIFFCLVTFAFVCTRGNLCSLKFWE